MLQAGASPIWISSPSAPTGSLLLAALRLNRHREGLEQFALVTSQEPEFEPPRDVVHKRLGVADLGFPDQPLGSKRM